MKNYSIQKQTLRVSMQKQMAKSSQSKHDDREFNVEESDHIDPDRADENIIETCYDTEEESMSITDAVTKIYTEYFNDTLKQFNNNRVKERHPERQKDMEEYAKAHPPEAGILQIGKCEDDVSMDMLVVCVKAYHKKLEEWNEEHNRPFELISTAYHGDEASNHAHTLTLWKGKDKKGNTVPNRESALEIAGVSLPKPGNKVSKRNNRNMVFTDMCRNMWMDVCQEYGFDVIKDPIQAQRGKNMGNYIRDREKDFNERLASLDEREHNLENRSQELDERENDIKKLDDEFTECMYQTVEEYSESYAKKYCKLMEEQQDFKKEKLEYFSNERLPIAIDFMKKCKGKDGSMYDAFCKYEKDALLKINQALEEAKLKTIVAEKNNAHTDRLLAELYRKYPQFKPKEKSKDYGMDL